ncbi:M56 family metallopeptidase [Streptacidiphilus sp. 4-A2]|nr:M56 family metallopeptidase [Streptacidiphilus sp. 4-A2]
MMHLLVYLPLLFPVPAALSARPLAERLDPRTATWLLAVCALALATLSSAALAVLAAAGLVRVPLIGWLGHWSTAIVGAGDSVSNAEAALAGLLLTGAAWAGGRMLWRRARALAAAAFEAACLPGLDQVVVVADPAPDAYALPGLPGRVVVSTGMLGALDAPDREAMLAHERAHLAGHHYAFLAVAQLAAAANPLLRPVSAAVAYTVERWADERAAAECGDRRQVARAVGKAALAATRTPAAAPCTPPRSACSAAAATRWPPPVRSRAGSPRCWPAAARRPAPPLDWSLPAGRHHRRRGRQRAVCLRRRARPAPAPGTRRRLTGDRPRRPDLSRRPGRRRAGCAARRGSPRPGLDLADGRPQRPADRPAAVLLLLRGQVPQAAVGLGVGEPGPGRTVRARGEVVRQVVLARRVTGREPRLPGVLGVEQHDALRPHQLAQALRLPPAQGRSGAASRNASAASAS